MGLAALLAGACNPDKLNCSSDSDCAQGETCDPTNKWCVRPAPPDVRRGCFVKADCAVGQYCGQDGTCLPDTVCGDGGWCRVDPLVPEPGDATMTPRPFYGPLSGVWGVADKGPIWAVGPGATILRYDGKAWTRQPAGVDTGDLRAIWGTGENNLYAVGELGLIIHYDGTKWTRQNSGVNAELTAIWGSGPDNIYAVGAFANQLSAVLRSTDAGQSWQQVQVRTPNAHTGFLHGIWGPSADRFYVVGANLATGQGPVLIYDAGTWRESGVREGNGFRRDYLRAVWGSGANDVWAVGEEGMAYYFDGANWRLAKTNVMTTLYGISGSPGGNVLAVGAQGSLLSLNGQGAWEKLGATTDGTFYGVFSANPQTGWIVGHNGIALRRQK